MESALQVLARERPGEGLAERGVAFAKGTDALDQIGEAVEIVGREHLALDDRKVQLDLIQPARMNGRRGP